MFRFLLLLFLIGTAFLLIEPSWAPASRTLMLRVRTPAEFVKGAERVARALGEKTAEGVAGEIANPPPVSEPRLERSAERTSERYSDEERARLDQLVEEKSRTP